MPQLDVFIFINTGIYLFIGFFLILAFNHLYIIPSIGSLLKIRKKIEKKKQVSTSSSTVGQLEIKPVSLDKYFK